MSKPRAEQVNSLPARTVLPQILIRGLTLLGQAVLTPWLWIPLACCRTRAQLERPVAPTREPRQDLYTQLLGIRK
jgi:hypothetical protein